MHNFCCVSPVLPPSLCCMCVCVYCLTISGLRRLNSIERIIERWTCCHVTELPPYVVMAVVGKATRSPPPTVSPNHPSSQTLLLSLLTKDWGEMCNTRWSNTLRFMDNALSQTVSEYIDCLFLVIEM